MSGAASPRAGDPLTRSLVIEYVDLTAPSPGPAPSDPYVARVQSVNAIIGAKVGRDIPKFARLHWAVCSLCDMPTVQCPFGSSCCSAPIRFQGWI